MHCALGLRHTGQIVYRRDKEKRRALGRALLFLPIYVCPLRYEYPVLAYVQPVAFAEGHIIKGAWQYLYPGARRRERVCRHP